MAYRIDVYPDAREQIHALPAEQLDALAEAMTVLSLTPWEAGRPYHEDNPNSPMRQLVFGSGWLVYLVLDDVGRVDVVRVMSTG